MARREVGVQPGVRVKNAMKVLIIALSGIGDALMFSPALEMMRRAYPDARIDLLAMFRGVEDLYLRNPLVNSVYYCDFLRWSSFRSLRFVLGLRRNKYDVSIEVYPANRWPYNAVSVLVGARLRVGHDYNRWNLRSMNFLNNRRVREDDAQHNVEENVRLVRLLGVNESTIPRMTIHLTEEDRERAGDWLKKATIGEGGLLIGMHAGSALFKNHIRRRWAPEKFAALAQRLKDDHGATVLLFGGRDEEEVNRTIVELSGGRALAVTVPGLVDAAAIMQRCALFVTNDSGLMHIAAGLGLPTVAVFAYTNPRYVYPWGTRWKIVRHEMECSPCFFYSPRPASCRWDEDQFRCITHIGVDEVYDAVRELLPS